MENESSLLSLALPKSVCENGVIKIPAVLSEKYREKLVTAGWLIDHQDGTGASGATGGATPEEVKQHFVHRFLGSASRMCFVCADPKEEQPEIRDAILEQLADGQVFLVDLAAGHGAGTLAVLAFISELRATMSIPKLPLNIHIFALDYSAAALQLFHEMLSQIDDALQANALTVKLTSYPCDLRISGDVDEVLEMMFEDAKAQNTNRFFCCISAVWGVSKEDFEQITASIRHAAARFGNSKRNSIGLWIEPSTKSWHFNIAATVALTFRKIMFSIVKKKDALEIKASATLPVPWQRTFAWQHPINGKEVAGHAQVMSFWSK